MMGLSMPTSPSPAAKALRIEMEELISDVQVRPPEPVAKGDERQDLEAVQFPRSPGSC
jgi:hypothetical protein